MATHGLVLLVEPDALLRRLIHGDLKERGCIVVDVEDHTAALRFAGLYPGSIDLVITDTMPSPEQERAFIGALQELPSGQSAKVIHLGSQPTATSTEGHRRLPACFDRHTLLRAVGELLPNEPHPCEPKRAAVFWGASRTPQPSAAF